jgi:hypothetical protein
MTAYLRDPDVQGQLDIGRRAEDARRLSRHSPARTDHLELPTAVPP